VHAGLGAKSGSVAIPAIDYTRGGNFGGVALVESNSGEPVPLHTLDSYSLASCDFMKVDVEGMERDVLEGARSVLAEHRPILYVKNDQAEKSAALIGWLMSNGYRLYWHLPPLFNSKNHFGRDENIFGKIVSVNMLCIPRSRPISVQKLREITSPEQTWRT
jgi:Methyltransferase FkbM domain